MAKRKRKLPLPVFIPPAPFWVNNPDYVQKNLSEVIELARNPEGRKPDVEKLMAAMDNLPREVRLAVHQYGGVIMAIRTRDASAVIAQYERKLQKTSIDLNAIEADDMLKSIGL